MRTFAAVALLSALVSAFALAGCTEAEPNNYTCKVTGKVVDLNNVTGSDADGFDPESACPKPTPPQLAFKGLPASIGIYQPLRFTWTVTNGSYPLGHAMLTEVRLSHHSVPADQLKGSDSYGVQLTKKEHQELPQTFAASEPWRPEAAAKVYLRIHGSIRGEGLPEQDFWSNETVLEVLPITPTGNTVVFIHGAGDSLGAIDPDGATVALGDKVAFHNSDVKDHTFTFESAPKCFTKPAALTASALEGETDGVLLTCPGNYKVVTDDVQPKTIEIAVPNPV